MGRHNGPGSCVACPDPGGKVAVHLGHVPNIDQYVSHHHEHQHHFSLAAKSFLDSKHRSEGSDMARAAVRRNARSWVFKDRGPVDISILRFRADRISQCLLATVKARIAYQQYLLLSMQSLNSPTKSAHLSIQLHSSCSFRS